MSFDPYADWLHIPADRRPPSFYALLGVPEFAGDVEQIRAQALERMAHVRRYQLGSRSNEAIRLLGELSLAFDTLVTEERRRQYDQSLRNRETAVDRQELTETRTDTPLEPPPKVIPTSVNGDRPLRGALEPPLAESKIEAVEVEEEYALPPPRYAALPLPPPLPPAPPVIAGCPFRIPPPKAKRLPLLPRLLQLEHRLWQRLLGQDNTMLHYFARLMIAVFVMMVMMAVVYQLRSPRAAQPIVVAAPQVQSTAAPPTELTDELSRQTAMESEVPGASADEPVVAIAAESAAETEDVAAVKDNAATAPNPAASRQTAFNATGAAVGIGGPAAPGIASKPPPPLPMASDAPAAPHPPPGAIVVNSVNLSFVSIPAGEFVMGSPPNEVGRNPAEQQHKVVIDKPFLIGPFEVTVAEFSRVMGVDADAIAGSSLSSKERHVHPVANVTWHEAAEFCEKLTQLAAERTAGRRYRLPTEAEWEYACRAGTKTPYHFPIVGSMANLNALANMGPPLEEGIDAVGRTTKRGWYPKNAFGLSDMHGNVAEWCADYYDPDFYGRSSEVSPLNTKPSALRVVRGGGYLSTAADCRSARRLSALADSRSADIGFRVVCDLGP